jgi:hypothetical protein
MAYTTFESDLLDASVPFAYIPTGAILTLAAPYSTLSDSDLASLGLLKCDSTAINTYDYSNLHQVISNKYGGTPYSAGITDNSDFYISFAYYAGVSESDGFSYRVDVYELTGLFNGQNVIPLDTMGGSVSAISYGYIYVTRYYYAAYVGAISIGLNKIFYLPDLHGSKRSIKGSSSTNTVGEISGNTHSHEVGTVTWNSTNNNTVMTHSHNAYSGNRVFATGNPAGHSHDGTPTATPSINANTLINSDANRNSNSHIWNYDSSSATNGNTGNTGLRQHAHVQNFNAYNTNASIYTDHTHNLPATGLANNTQFNSTGTAFTNAHSHSTTLVTSNTTNLVSPYPVPYSPMLYFIKA